MSEDFAKIDNNHNLLAFTPILIYYLAVAPRSATCAFLSISYTIGSVSSQPPQIFL